MAKKITSIEELLKEGVNIFKKEYHSLPRIAGIAPGRVNLIGGHTDYNQGFVFPMALPVVTIVLGEKTNSGICRVLTANENAGKPHKVEFPVPTESNPLESGEPKWANYVKGVVQYFDGPKVSFDAVVISSVPMGGGLSSSAALEVSTYSFLEGITGRITKPKDKALFCQKAEHNFAQVPCGIMDQLIIVYGKTGCATFIDCKSLDTCNVVIPSSDSVFLIINSNVHHELASSAYSDRRQTCVKIAHKLNKESLREVSFAELEKLKSTGLIDDVSYKRARHVISENERTLKAVEALKKNNLKEFGNLMNQSSDSLSKDHEVSCKEIDTIVAATREIEGVYGSRMTGGGFGGCTITLLEKFAVDNVINKIRKVYDKEADFYVVTPSAGATNLLLDAFI